MLIAIIVLFIIVIVQGVCILSLKSDVESAHRNIGFTNMELRQKKILNDFSVSRSIKHE